MAVLPPPCQSAVVRPDRPSELWFIQASVVFLFLLPGLNARLRPTLTAQLRPGARVLSAEFQVLAIHLVGQCIHGCHAVRAASSYSLLTAYYSLFTTQSRYL